MWQMSNVVDVAELEELRTVVWPAVSDRFWRALALAVCTAVFKVGRDGVALFAGGLQDPKDGRVSLIVRWFEDGQLAIQNILVPFNSDFLEVLGRHPRMRLAQQTRGVVGVGRRGGDNEPVKERLTGLLETEIIHDRKEKVQGFVGR